MSAERRTHGVVREDHAPATHWLLCVAIIVLLPSSALSQAPDPFSLGPFTPYAVFSLQNMTINGTTDSTGGASTQQGHVRSNGNIAVNSSGKVYGDAIPGPGKVVTKNSGAVVTGSTAPAAVEPNARPVDLAALKTQIQTRNDNLYESKEIIVGIADPRATRAYQTSLQGNPDLKGNEKTQCRRCEWPSYLTALPETDVKELLVGGPYIRTYLHSPDPNSPGYHEATWQALQFFASTDGGYLAPGTNDLAEKWGQFSYGYRQGDAYLETRNTSNLPSQPNANTGLFTQQGFRWTLDGARRLQKAEAGAFDAFNLEYGAGDELKTNTREASGALTDYKAGARGRITERTGTPFTYDAEGRRISDDRFDLQWNWRGELVKATVRLDWTGSPHAGRLLTREHRGGIPQGGTDDQRPLIEKREYLWDGESLLAETASDTAGTLKWRKSYVPGASGLDDAVQLKVENYQAGGVPERLFSYLRDELGTVTGLVEESQSGNPRAPPVAIRYFYDAFGSAHAELGPEVVKTKFDSALTQFNKPDGAPATQTATATTQPGTLRILFTSPVTAATLETGVVLEKLTSGTWTALTAAQRAYGFDTDLSEELLILPLNGWEKNGLYRVRLTSDLKDASNRSVVTPPVIQSLIPEQTQPVTFDASYPLLFETAFASSERSSGLLPGGQPMLFAGAWSDPVLGIAYHRARWYDPRNGVFLSEDPAADRDSRNYYAYAAFAPQQFTDPLGRCIGLDDIECKEYLREFGAQFLEDPWGSAKRSFRFGGQMIEGALKAPKTVAKGIYSVATNLPGTMAGVGEGLTSALEDPQGAWKRIGNAAMNADPDEAGQAVGEALLMSAVGGGAVAKIAGRLETAGTFARAGSALSRGTRRMARAFGREARAVTHSDDFKVLRRAEDALKGCLVTNSFPKGTVIATSDGEKPIEDVMPGDSVFAYDELAKSFTLQPVAFRFVYQKDETLTLTVNGEEIVTTAGHPFFSPGKGWVEAGKLAIGDGLLTLSGEPARVEGLEKKVGEFGLFNFEVVIDHSFFVGKSGVLVHNACPTTPKRPSAFSFTTKAQTTIYEVFDLTSQKTIYVGKTFQQGGTAQGLAQRLQQHIAEKGWTPGQYDIRAAKSGNWSLFEAATHEMKTIMKHGGLPVLQNKIRTITPKKFAKYKHLHANFETDPFR